MPWTKHTVENAWRILNASLVVIADALEVPVDELRDMYFEGIVPAPPALTPEQIEVMADEVAMPPDPEPETKRATRADLAPVAPETVLEQAAPIDEKPLTFRPPPKRPAYVPTVSKPAPNAVAAVDTLIGESLDDRPMPRRRSNLATTAEDKRRPHKPAEFYLMHEGRYLHQSCTGLTDKKQFAWCQPENKIAAVRKRYPETVDYLEVQA